MPNENGRQNRRTEEQGNGNPKLPAMSECEDEKADGHFQWLVVSGQWLAASQS
jgi:hypothetical protein